MGTGSQTYVAGPVPAQPAWWKIAARPAASASCVKRTCVQPGNAAFAPRPPRRRRGIVGAGRPGEQTAATRTRSPRTGWPKSCSRSARHGERDFGAGRVVVDEIDGYLCRQMSSSRFRDGEAPSEPSVSQQARSCLRRFRRPLARHCFRGEFGHHTAAAHHLADGHPITPRRTPRRGGLCTRDES